MQGTPLDCVKTALLTALYNLNPVDTFNIIVFNESSLLFSSSMVQATKEMIGKASEWIEMKFIAEGGTNIAAPLNQVFGKNFFQLSINDSCGFHCLIFLYLNFFCYTICTFQ